MWKKEEKPTDSKWMLVKINGQSTPMLYNVYNNFFSSFSGKTFQMNEIDSWLDEDSIPENAVIVSGFISKKDAEEFKKWYSGQGEQDSEFWQTCHSPDSDWYLRNSGLKMEVF